MEHMSFHVAYHTITIISLPQYMMNRNHILGIGRTPIVHSCPLPSAGIAKSSLLNRRVNAPSLSCLVSVAVWRYVCVLGGVSPTPTNTSNPETTRSQRDIFISKAFFRLHGICVYASPAGLLAVTLHLPCIFTVFFVASVTDESKPIFSPGSRIRRSWNIARVLIKSN